MKETAQYRTRLEEEKGVLESELTNIGRRNPSNPSDWEALPQEREPEQEADQNDVATKISNFEDNTAILKDLEIRYNDVLAALARIEDGSYGVCEVSGEEIEDDRLGADPAARTCKAHLNEK